MVQIVNKIGKMTVNEGSG